MANKKKLQMAAILGAMGLLVFAMYSILTKGSIKLEFSFTFLLALGLAAVVWIYANKKMGESKIEGKSKLVGGLIAAFATFFAVYQFFAQGVMTIILISILLIILWKLGIVKALMDLLFLGRKSKKK